MIGYATQRERSAKMPKGPRGEKRPADVIGNAVKVMWIATGDLQEEVDHGNPPKDEAAAALGRRGGKARAQKLSKKRRTEIAIKAARARWRKTDSD